MSWTPSNTQLYTIDQLSELVNFSVPITYTDSVGFPSETWTVTITPSQVNSTVSTSGGTISGYYSSVFDGYSIQYLNNNGEYSTVVDWTNISGAKEIVNYHPVMVQTKTYTYTATAVSSLTNTTVTQTYTIVVTNNWTVGKNNLQTAVNNTRV